MRRAIVTSLAALGLAAATSMVAAETADAASTPKGGHHHSGLKTRSAGGSFAYVLRGRIPHAPGNVHSGSLRIGAYDGDGGQILDWRCPRGVTPPTESYDYPPPPTRCTLLRGITTVEEGLVDYPVVDYRMRRLHTASRHRVQVFDVIPGQHNHLRADTDFTMLGSGPITSGVIYQTYDRRVVARQRASTRVTGHFGWIRFCDPRIKIIDGQMRGEFVFVRRH